MLRLTRDPLINVILLLFFALFASASVQHHSWGSLALGIALIAICLFNIAKGTFARSHEQTSKSVRQ
jgi:hypothetical protein